MSDHCEIDVRGERLTLLPDRSVLWRRTSTLFIADLHLGKDEVFRRRGVAVPSGVVATDLQRLTALIGEHNVQRLVLLGDFVHAAPHATSDFVEDFARWREEHRAMQMIVVAGNHDRRMAGHRLSMMVEWCEREWTEAPFVARHHPGESAAGYVLCGHIHPVVKMEFRRERLRLPAFWFTNTHAVLPSFGSFTGGANVSPGEGDQIFVAGEGIVRRIPASSAQVRGRRGRN